MGDIAARPARGAPSYPVGPIRLTSPLVDLGLAAVVLAGRGVMGGSVREVCTPRVGVAARQHACQGIAEQRHPVHIADRSALAGMTEAQQRDAHYRAWVDREATLPPNVVRSLV